MLLNILEFHLGFFLYEPWLRYNLLYGTKVEDLLAFSLKSRDIVKWLCFARNDVPENPRDPWPQCRGSCSGR